MSKEELVEILEYLKEQVSGPAEQVFRMAVRYELTAAIIWLVVGAAALIGAGLLFRWRQRYEFDRYGIGEDMSGLAVGFLALFGLIAIIFNIHALLNIEYVALRSFLP